MNSRWAFVGGVAVMLVLALTAGLTYAQGPQPLRGAQMQGETGALALVGTAFTYQGQLKRDGNPVNDTCDFQFSLWDAAGSGSPPSGGSQVGATQTRTSVQVTNGLFTIPDLDFGDGAFQGDARWLEIAVKCAGDADYATLSPRQALTPVPYALALPGLWTQPDANNLIGGYSGNSVGASTIGATIGGGGSNTSPNSVTGNYGTVGGGFSNTVGGFAATVGGGRLNNAGSQDVAIGGGAANNASGKAATIAGGNQNTASGYATTVSGGGNNTALGDGAAVGGGMNNKVSGGNSVIGGGAYNTISATVAAIGGGHSNLITGTASYAAIAGGYNITVTGRYAAASGGRNNTASGDGATVGGGDGNTASGTGAAVGGGGNNKASGWNATVAGGGGNTASGINAAVGGGYGNVASGGDATIAGGHLNTASGDRAAIGGGQNNTAEGDYATVGGGWYNVAAFPYATIPGGYRALADQYGQMAYASGRFSSNGDAQTSLYVMRNTSGGSSWTDLYLDGSYARLAVASGRTMTFDILVVGRSDAGESAGYRVEGVIENVGGTVAFIGTPTVTTLGEDDPAWDVQVSLDTSLGALLVQVRGNGETIRWVATVRTAEVAW